jgi:hypothetical protein
MAQRANRISDPSLNGKMARLKTEPDDSRRRFEASDIIFAPPSGIFAAVTSNPHR